MANLTIRKVDEAYIHVEADEDSTTRDLVSYFEFHSPGYQYAKAYKEKRWDGKTKLYSPATHKILAGLLRHVQKFADDRKLTVELDKDLGVMNNFSLAEAEEFAAYKNLPVEVRDYQIMGLAKAIRYKRMLIESPTGSGKSLMMYLIARYLSEKESLRRGVIIVPNQNLVEQLYSDFESYSVHERGWRVGEQCQRLYEGYNRDIKAPILITTWQSFIKMPKEWETFDWVIGDEAHGFTADSLKTIMTGMTNAKYRIGTTGTVQDTKIHKLMLEGHFGPHSKVASTKELQDKGQLAKIRLKALILKHNAAACQTLKKLDDWNDEMDYLVKKTERNRFIANLAKSLKGNVLILFNYQEHGEILEHALCESNKQVYLVYGKTDVEIREEVRRIAEVAHDCVIVASYGVFSTGTNIKNIPHIIFASPSKSKKRVLQSIGRGLRLHDDKEFLTVYDITDDLRWKKWINHTLKQFVERLKIYEEEGWTVSKYLIEL